MKRLVDMDQRILRLMVWLQQKQIQELEKPKAKGAEGLFDPSAEKSK